MHFMKAIAIFITGIFTGRMIDRLVLIAPFFEARVNIVLVRVHQAAGLNHLRQDRLDGHLLDVGQHPNHDFPCALQQSQDRWFFIGQGAPSAFAFQAATAAFAPQFRHSSKRAFFDHHPFAQLRGHDLRPIGVQV